MKTTGLVPVERIERKIYLIRGERVMLDRDLAGLYGVTTKVFNQAVKRHLDRFPADFMLELTMEEARSWWADVIAARLRSQNVTLKRGQHIKYRPHAFTEHGILMSSSVLNSNRAIQANIQIIRSFVKLRQMLASNTELARKLEELETKYDHQFKIVFDAIRQCGHRPGRQFDHLRSGFQGAEHVSLSEGIARLLEGHPNLAGQ